MNTEKLKALREKFGYSQDKLADRLGITRHMVLRIEHGDVPAPVRIVKAIAKLFEVSTDYLLDM